MSEESPDTHLPAPSNRHKFPLGHKFGRGNPMGRAVNLLRVQIIRSLKAGKTIPRVMERLEQLAFDDLPSGKDVDPKVQLAALKELLCRGVGKATEFKVIEDNRAVASPPASIEEWVERLSRLGIPHEAWPPIIREAYRKKAASRVIEPEKGAS